jgi:hypothetical protein
MVVIGALGVVEGVGITTGNGVLFLVACVVPPAVMLLVWRGAPPATVAELLYTVDTPPIEPRP